MMEIEWNIGDRIRGRWQVYDIKRGGMGVVYIVYDHEWKQAHAAKTFKSEAFLENPAIADRFTREALTWIRLDAHQNVTQARFVERIDEKPYVFLEFVSGGDLSGWIGTPRLTQNLTEVLRLSIQFCDGMIHARSKGVKVHRDLKPQNCLITEDGVLKISDFGLAKIFDEAQSTATRFQDSPIDQTQTGVGVGTLPYMAPEQFLDAKTVDVRADIYSFGVMLYLMATGSLPFVGRSGCEFAQLHMRAPVPILEHDLQPLNIIVHGCLAKDYAKRFSDFSQLRAHLAPLYERLSGKQSPEPARADVLQAMEWNNKGASLGVLGRFEEELVCLDRAIQIKSDLAIAWANRGVTLSHLGRHEEAADAYDRAISIAPDDEDTWCNRGRFLEKLKKHAESMECFDKALALNPFSDAAWLGKGNSFAKTGDYSRAIACYDKALIINPRDMHALHNKGNALKHLERFEDAEECLRDVLSFEPDHEAALLSLGIVLHKLNQPEAALKCFERVTTLNPNNAEAWLGRGMILYGALCRDSDARECFLRAKRLGHPRAEEFAKKCESP